MENSLKARFQANETGVAKNDLYIKKRSKYY